MRVAGVQHCTRSRRDAGRRTGLPPRFLRRHGTSRVLVRGAVPNARPRAGCVAHGALGRGRMVRQAAWNARPGCAGGRARDGIHADASLPAPIVRRPHDAARRRRSRAMVDAAGRPWKTRPNGEPSRPGILRRLRVVLPCRRSSRRARASGKPHAIRDARRSRIAVGDAAAAGARRLRWREKVAEIRAGRPPMEAYAERLPAARERSDVAERHRSDRGIIGMRLDRLMRPRA